VADPVLDGGEFSALFAENSPRSWSRQWDLRGSAAYAAVTSFRNRATASLNKAGVSQYMECGAPVTTSTRAEGSSSPARRDTREPEIPSARAAWLELGDFVTPTKLRVIVSRSISLLAAY
jgi:hypothetical protein